MANELLPPHPDPLPLKKGGEGGIGPMGDVQRP